MQYLTPWAVASSRPSEPPSKIGFPVTTAGEYPRRFEYSSSSQAMTCWSVPMSGAGMSR